MALFSSAKLNKDERNIDDGGAENSDEIRVADKRAVTSQKLQKLASMVPDLSEGVVDKVHDGVDSMLALTKDPNNRQLLPPLGQEEKREKRHRLLTKLGVACTNQASEEIAVASINDLPEEVLLEFMSYLNLAARKNARLVCKQWHRLSYDKKLIKNDWTSIVPSKYLNCTSPNSRHLNVIVHENGEWTSPFWETHGEHVETIEFKYFKSNSLALPRVLRCCPNVKHIIMSLKPAAGKQVISFPVVPLLHLERLELGRSSLKYGVDMVAALFQQTPRLREISTVLPEMLHRPPSEVLEVIRRHSTTLEELNLGYGSADEQITHVVASVESQLRRLYLDGGLLLTDSSLYAIAEKFVNLEHLSVANTRISFSALDYAVSSLNNLTHLSLKGVGLLDAPNSFFTAIDNWTQLIAIDLRDTGVKARKLEIAFRSPHPKLVNLQFDGWGTYDFGELTEIWANLPNLIILRLNSCRISNETLQAIAQHSTQLEDLALSNTRGWRSSVILNDIKTLKHLSLSSVKQGAVKVRALSLPALRTIDLRYTKISSEDMLQLVEGNRSLHHIEVSNERDWHPSYKNVLTDEILELLQRRRPSYPCPRRDNIFCC